MVLLVSLLCSPHVVSPVTVIFSFHACFFWSPSLLLSSSIVFVMLSFSFSVFLRRFCFTLLESFVFCPYLFTFLCFVSCLIGGSLSEWFPLDCIFFCSLVVFPLLPCIFLLGDSAAGLEPHSRFDRFATLPHPTGIEAPKAVCKFQRRRVLKS